MGWIKLHRKMLEWEWYKDINTKVLFIHLLLVANFEDNEWQGMIIKRGQRFTSVKSLSTELRLSCKAVRTALSKLRKGKQIDTKTANKGTMITICKYDEYQIIEKPNGKQRANKTIIEGQQIKKDKEEVRNNIEERIRIFKDSVFSFTQYPTEMLTAFFNYWSEHNHSQTKFKKELQETWDTAKRLTTWANRDKNFKPEPEKPKAGFTLPPKDGQGQN